MTAERVPAGRSLPVDARAAQLTLPPRTKAQLSRFLYREAMNLAAAAEGGHTSGARHHADVGSRLCVAAWTQLAPPLAIPHTLLRRLPSK